MLEVCIEFEHKAPNGCKTIEHEVFEVECKELEEILDFQYSMDIQYRKVTILSAKVKPK